MFSSFSSPNSEKWYFSSFSSFRGHPVCGLALLETWINTRGGLFGSEALFVKTAIERGGLFGSEGLIDHLQYIDNKISTKYF